MADLADLYPGFASHWLDAPCGKIFGRSKGQGAPLVLLHGYPQTHAMWHKIAPQLAEKFRVIVLDLRGYGWSSAPASHKGAGYTKRVMAEDIIAALDQLGVARFSLVGHDRGGRVGYRLALDHKGRVDKLAVVDIVPTYEMWARMDAARAMQAYHWLFLAQPEPMPETLIGSSPTQYLDHTIASWTASGDLKSFDPRAMDHYRASFNDPTRIHAACEDYRAGATLDNDYDAQDLAAGNKIIVPLLALWGETGIAAKAPQGTPSPLDLWRKWGTQVQGAALKGGHFLPEENPDATLEALMGFL